MGRHDAERSGDPLVMVANPDEDCSPEAFRAFIDDLLGGPEPELETVHAAAALREISADAEASPPS